MGIKQISISFIKIILASIVMGILAKLFFNYLITSLFSQNLALIGAILVGVVSYFIIIYFMRIEEVDTISKAVKARMG